MKRFHYCLLLAPLLISSLLQAQNTPFRTPPSDHSNFYDVVEKANEFFDENEQLENATEEDNDYFRFKRWEWYWKDRVMPDGSFPDLLAQKRVYDELQSAANQNRDINSPWTNINQTYGDGGYNGMGRATSIAFHPTNPDVFYVGAPIGGIWKTTDGGNSYSALGDSLPYVSAGNICIDQQNPDNIFITVGDNTGWWNYGLGVFKSEDAGVTWNATTNISSFTDNVAYLRMVINPYDGNEIFSAQTNGLFRSQDGGLNWEIVHDGSHSDVVFQPANDSTLYCATDDYWGNSEVYISSDHGTTWSQISDFNQSANSIHLTVSIAEPLYLGIESSVSGAPDFYASDDGGLTVFYISAMPEEGVIFTSPLSTDTLYCGYVVVYRSTNGGLSWEQITDWWNSGAFTEVHADNHFVAHHPTTNDVYFCNDGGIYRLKEQLQQWHELTSGLIITQYYRIAVSQIEPIFMIGGTQDNGGRKRVALGEWAATNGGDAMEVAINFEDDAIIYSTYVNGQLYRSYDRWEDDTYFEITPPNASSGAWVTPYVLDPSNSSTIVAGYEDVYRSTDDGSSWDAISNNLTGNSGNKIDAVAVAVNPDYIFAARNNLMYVTLNGGQNWSTEISAPASTNISSIITHPYDSNKLWITVSGYGNGQKVYFSEDAGETFSNISYNLPNVPCNTAAVDRESSQLDLYVGTDVGVFVFDDAANTWNYFGAGMPNTSITDLEIQYSSRKIRAATFGRGIWENDLMSEPGVKVQESVQNTETTIAINHNPIRESLVLDIHSHDNFSGEWVVTALNGAIILRQQGRIVPGNYQYVLNVSSLASGTYVVQFQSSSKKMNGMKFMKSAE